MKRSTDARIQLFLSVIIVLMVNGCGRESAISNRNEQTAVKKVRVGYIPIVECAHLYVGITKEYFKQEGLEIELVPMKGGAAILPAVQKGDIDIGFANVVSMVLLNQNNKEDKSPEWLLSVAGASYERPENSNHALIVRKNETYSAQQLVENNIKIGINTYRNIEELMLLRYLDASDVDVKTRPLKNLIPISFPEMLSALRNKSIDVASTVEPFIEPAIRGGEFSLLARQYLTVSTNTVVATYVTSQRYLENSLSEVKAFSRAFVGADKFIRDHDLETRQILSSYTRISQGDVPIIGLPAFEPSLRIEPLNDLCKAMLDFGFVTNATRSAEMIWREE